MHQSYESLLHADDHRSHGDSGKASNVLAEFACSLINAGIEKPCRGVAQIIDQSTGSQWDKSIQGAFRNCAMVEPESAKFGSGDWYAQQLGGAVGMLIPLLAIRGGLSAVGSRIINENLLGPQLIDFASSKGLAQSAGLEAIHSAAIGAIYGSILSPSSDTVTGKAAFIEDRAKSGLASMTVFGAMGAMNPYLSKGFATLAGLSETSALAPGARASLSALLKGPLLPGMAAGIPGGIISAEVNAWKNGRASANFDELKENAVAMGFVGGALSGAAWLGSECKNGQSTNSRAISDKLGFTKPANLAQADFNIVKEKENLLQFHKDVSAGKDQAQANVQARQELETIGSAFFGDRLRTSSSIKNVLLHHSEDSSIPLKALAPGKIDLIATCSEVDPSLKELLLFKVRENAADKRVWLSSDSRDNFKIQQTNPFEFRVQMQADRNSESLQQVKNLQHLEPVALGHRRSLPFREENWDSSGPGPESLIMVNEIPLACGETLSIGSGSRSDIKFSNLDKSIESDHAILGRTYDGIMYIQDNSSSGIKVGGVLISKGENFPVRFFDEISIGKNGAAIAFKYGEKDEEYDSNLAAKAIAERHADNRAKEKFEQVAEAIAALLRSKQKTNSTTKGSDASGHSRITSLTTNESKMAALRMAQKQSEAQAKLDARNEALKAKDQSKHKEKTVENVAPYKKLGKQIATIEISGQKNLHTPVYGTKHEAYLVALHFASTLKDFYDLPEAKASSQEVKLLGYVPQINLGSKFRNAEGTLFLNANEKPAGLSTSSRFIKIDAPKLTDLKSATHP